LNTRLGPRELAQQIKDAEPALLLAEEGFVPQIQALLRLLSRAFARTVGTDVSVKRIRSLPIKNQLSA
jgi:hypothetical protein